ncbi:hypothetical protein ABPG72_003271 [Tetrahymena utriculariae]
MIPLIAFVGLLFFWSKSYKMMVKQGIQSETSFAILSMTHWLLAFVYFQTIVSFQLDKDVEQKIFGNKLTLVQLWFHVLTCSYFTFDLAARFYKKQLSQWLLIHHSFTLLFILIAILYQSSGSENIYVLRYSTFCNVPMNMKTILAKKGMQISNPYHICNLFYAIIYSINFLYFLPLLLIQFYQSNTSILTFFMLLLLCIQAHYTIVKLHCPSFVSSIRYFKNKYMNEVF